MALPALTDWDSTRAGLHRASQVIGGIRRTAIAPLPNWAHLGLLPVSHGLSTGTLPVGEFSLDFGERLIRYTEPGGGAAQITLDGHDQVSLTDAVLGVLEKAGHRVDLNREKLTDATRFAVDAASGGRYAEALFRIYTAVARFRAGLLGPMSPVIVWPHGFDLSFLWFPGAGMQEDKDPHLNFGFSPGSPGLERPYVYAYSWPLVAGLTQKPLPPQARWHTTGWTGIVIDYDTLAAEADPEAALESLLRALYNILAPTIS